MHARVIPRGERVTTQVLLPWNPPDHSTYDTAQLRVRPVNEGQFHDQRMRHCLFHELRLGSARRSGLDLNSRPAIDQ